MKRNYKSECFILELFGDVPWDKMLAFVVWNVNMPTKTFCPICGSISIRYGKTKDSDQRYHCYACHHTFITKQSPKKYLRHKTALLKKFLGYMIDDVTLDVAARNLNINIKTAHYYRYIVFHAIKDYQEEIILDGSIMIDETFVSIREKQYKLLRHDGKDIRGLSFNLLCIITMVNLHGICTAKISSRGMAQPDDFKRLFNHNIGFVKQFIHDGNPKQVQFMNQFDVIKINARKDPSGSFSTNIVDSLHSNVKRYLFKHAGYRLKNLQHYMNFFVYRYNHLILSNPQNKTEQLKAKNLMIEDLYKRMMKTTKTITYQAYLSDDGITDILKTHMERHQH